MKPIIIGVAGGTGSGKTTVVKEMIVAVGTGDVAIIEHDAYYRDQSHLPMKERARQNYDHPDALETDLLVRHLEELRRGNPVEVPVYDFTEHTRRPDTQTVRPKKAIIVEGILVLFDAALRDLMDIKVYVDTDADIRFIRRLQRDLAERGRTMESVIEQYLGSVKPAHDDFVEPSRRHADIIIPEGGHNRVAVDMLLTKVQSIVSGS